MIWSLPVTPTAREWSNKTSRGCVELPRRAHRSCLVGLQHRAQFTIAPTGRLRSRAPPLGLRNLQIEQVKADLPSLQKILRRSRPGLTLREASMSWSSSRRASNSSWSTIETATSCRSCRWIRRHVRYRHLCTPSRAQSRPFSSCPWISSTWISACGNHSLRSSISRSHRLRMSSTRSWSCIWSSQSLSIWISQRSWSRT